MSTLPETFEAVLPCLVAFATRRKETLPGQEPILPEILATGFVVDERGVVVTNRHVVEAIIGQPPHPKTRCSPVIGVITPGVREATGGHTMPILAVTLKAGAAVTEFSTGAGPYYGAPVPDLAFVQLNVKNLHHLSLTTEAGSWVVGSSVAIAGFPLGTVPLELFGKVTQVMPSLKHGVISSVQPFPCPFPHGFSTDVLTQPGNSGSPVFLADKPIVLGVHKCVLKGGDNIALAEPSYLVSRALDQFLSGGHLEDTAGVPTIEDSLAQPWVDTPVWEKLL